MSVDCTCDDWQENIAKVNGPILLQTARSGGAYQYSGRKFVYCPWCGRPLSGATDQPPASHYEIPLYETQKRGKAWLESLPTLARCQECDGTGWQIFNGRGRSCPTCSGTGRLSNQTKEVQK